MMISVIATLLIAAMGTTATNMNASAFNFGLKSNDVNDGSISTNSLFSCVGAAINCVNTNEGNNNVVANNTAAVGNGNGNGNGNGILTCEECLSDALTADQQVLLFANLEVTNLAQACVAIALEDPTVLFQILVNIGLSVDAALELLACLDIDAPVVIT
ncbi:hypothetical protein BH23THE1_BH23THE1_17590 [soil metagenome]